MAPRLTRWFAQPRALAALTGLTTLASATLLTCGAAMATGAHAVGAAGMPAMPAALAAPGGSVAAVASPLLAASAKSAPALLKGVLEAAPLPDGGWLALDKQALSLLAADGSVRSRLALRARTLDTRTVAGGVLAMVIDQNSERPVLVDVDLAAGVLRLRAAPPAPPFAPEAACLYRDAQQLDYLFLVAKDGQAQQWLLDGATAPRLVRHLALPPATKQCRVHDASATLLAYESGMGLWGYHADAEGPGARTALALAKPYGPLSGHGALAVTPGGAVLADGATLHRFQAVAGRWKALTPAALPATGPWQALATTGPVLTASATLAAYDTSAKAWRTVRATLPPPVDTTPPAVIVQPHTQTEPMARTGDAADDPAIWVHPSDPGASRVLGTNKKQGLLVYDMQGRQTQLLEVGRLNNVDLRQRVRWANGVTEDLAVATQRDDNVLVLFSIAADGAVAEAARFATGMDKIYGVCAYQPASGGMEVFVNDKDGLFHQYRLHHLADPDPARRYKAERVRTFRTDTQPEGCVADDRHGVLFFGEEKRGVWTLPADASPATANATARMVLAAGGVLTADVEGMALYHGAQASYLVVSSQGSNSYVVLDAQAPFRVRGSFRIGVNAGAGIDGASETDGLDVTSAALGGPYGAGMLVVQDGYKRLPDGPQNFKYVSWAEVAKALQLP